MRTWTAEEIKTLVQTNDKVLYGALKQLYNCQTADEKALIMSKTIFHALSFLIIGIVFFRNSLLDDNTVFGFIVQSRWTKGINIFSISAVIVVCFVYNFIITKFIDIVWHPGTFFADHYAIAWLILQIEVWHFRFSIEKNYSSCETISKILEGTVKFNIRFINVIHSCSLKFSRIKDERHWFYYVQTQAKTSTKPGNSAGILGYFWFK